MLHANANIANSMVEHDDKICQGMPSQNELICTQQVTQSVCHGFHKIGQECKVN